MSTRDQRGACLSVILEFWNVQTKVQKVFETVMNCHFYQFKSCAPGYCISKTKRLLTVCLHTPSWFCHSRKSFRWWCRLFSVSAVGQKLGQFHTRQNTISIGLSLGCIQNVQLHAAQLAAFSGLIWKEETPMFQHLCCTRPRFRPEMIFALLCTKHQNNHQAGSVMAKTELVTYIEKSSRNHAGLANTLPLRINKHRTSVRSQLSRRDVLCWAHFVTSKLTIDQSFYVIVCIFRRWKGRFLRKWWSLLSYYRIALWNLNYLYVSILSHSARPYF